MALRLYYCDQYEFALPQGHKFPTRKYRLLRETLAADGAIETVPAPLAKRSDIELVHDREYVESFLDGTLDPAMMRRIGFPWSEGLVNRTLASVGGTQSAAADALERGVGGNLAGGTHHAFPDCGSGFCIFNDIAITIRCLQRDRRVRRAAIVDLDVHQGDGTAVIFRQDPDVLTVSIHGAKNFPFRKQESKLDVALPDGTDDVHFLTVLAETLPQVTDFKPDVVFFQSGVDGLRTDCLGRLELSPQGLADRDQLVIRLCHHAGIPLVIVLGGGYSNPITATVQAHATTFRTAAETYS